MTNPSSNRPVVLVGCGRLGSAILEGWLTTSTVSAGELIILNPDENPATTDARACGASVNPPAGSLGTARVVVLAVKPAMWREAVAPLLDNLPSDTPVVSVMAGVKAGEIGGVVRRPVARVMPTTGVAQARGVASLWSDDDGAREAGRALFAAIADVVDLPAEDVMDAATATAGSAPAFVYAFVQALARAGEAEGLSRDAAERLARGALRSAGAGAETGAGLEDLVARIASPGGTTRAGLDAMAAGGDLDRAAEAAVKAAVARAREISG